MDERGRGQLLLHAPVTLQKECPKETDCTVNFQVLELEANRPLHAKCLWLENQNWSVYLMGSSNFTSAGLGLGLISNLEANLAYIIHQGRNSKGRRALNDGWLPSNPIMRDFRLEQEPPIEQGQDAPTGDEILLPRQFGEATFGVDAKQYFLSLSVHGSPPAGWVLLHESKDDHTIFTEKEWLRGGRKPTHPDSLKDIARSRTSALAGMRWNTSLAGLGGRLTWSMPVPSLAARRAPSVEFLMNWSPFLNPRPWSPLHQAIARMLQRRSNQNIPDKDVLDPHRRVDTSAIP